MFWVTTPVSLLLLGAAGAMLDALVRDPRGRLRGARATSSARFARLRRMRRTAAGVLTGVVGVLFALWPAVPRQPKWVLAFTGLLTLATLGLLTMGVWDALASTRHYRRLARRRAGRGVDELHRLVSQHRQARDEQN